MCGGRGEFSFRVLGRGVVVASRGREDFRNYFFYEKEKKGKVFHLTKKGGTRPVPRGGGTNLAKPCARKRREPDFFLLWKGEISLLPSRKERGCAFGGRRGVIPHRQARRKRRGRKKP